MQNRKSGLENTANGLFSLADLDIVQFRLNYYLDNAPKR
jgi:hypothetical protein